MARKKEKLSDGKPHRPLFKHHRVDARHPMPGPGRRYDRRHFARMASGEAIVFFVMVALIVAWFLIDLGVLPNVFERNIELR